MGIHRWDRPLAPLRAGKTHTLAGRADQSRKWTYRRGKQTVITALQADRSVVGPLDVDSWVGWFNHRRLHSHCGDIPTPLCVKPAVSCL